MRLYPWIGWLIGFAILWRFRALTPPRARRELPATSVIVPARNEENNLRRLLESLRSQEAAAEVIVVDDHSTDATAEVARRHGARLVSSADLPEGWVGKPWACLQGARAASGEVLVFLDADTWLTAEGLAAIVAAQAETGGVVSVQPYHRMERAYERIAAFFNLITVAGIGSFTALGDRLRPTGCFGPCLACDRRDYFAIGGHETARAAVIEGIPLGQAFLEHGISVTNFVGRGALSFRMYPEGLRSVVEGFVKSFGAGSRSVSPSMLVAVILWIAGAAAATRHLLVALPASDALLPALALYIAYAAQLGWMLSRIGNFGWWPALLFPAPMLFFFAVFAESLVATFGRRQVRWKDRDVRMD